MTAGRNIVALLVVGIALSGTVYADMAVSGPLGGGETAWLRAQPAPERPLAGDPFLDSSFATSPLVRRPLPSAGAPEAVRDSQTVHILTERQDSLHLGMWALLSLGLCKSAPWVKRVSLGVIPDWYHDGGPFQLGHSLAVSPDCLNSTSVCCFIQPESRDEAPMPQCRRRGIISLWRETQFTPAVRASRAPPHRFC
jgi:hypothetical protein